MIALADVAVFARQIALVLATQLAKGNARMVAIAVVSLDAKVVAKEVAQVVLVVLGRVKGVVLAVYHHLQYKLINWKGRKTYEYYFY